MAPKPLGRIGSPENGNRVRTTFHRYKIGKAQGFVKDFCAIHICHGDAGPDLGFGGFEGHRSFRMR